MEVKVETIEPGIEIRIRMERETEIKTHRHTDVSLYRISLEGFRIQDNQSEQLLSGSEKTCLKDSSRKENFPSPSLLILCYMHVLPYICHSANLN